MARYKVYICMFHGPAVEVYTKSSPFRIGAFTTFIQGKIRQNELMVCGSVLETLFERVCIKGLYSDVKKEKSVEWI